MNAIPFSLKDAVEKRYSARTFTKESVGEEICKRILNFASEIKNPLGPKIRVRFIEKNGEAKGEKLGTYGVIKNASLFLGAAVKNQPGALESLGYEFEEIILYITSLGLGTCWLGGTFNQAAFSKVMECADDEIFPVISPLGFAADKKRIFEKIMRSGIKADTRFSWDKIFFKDDFSTPLSKNHLMGEKFSDYVQALDYVRLAPSAVNKQPWRIIFDGSAFHFFENQTMEAGENGDLQRIDLGIAICHFHLAALEKNLPGHFEKTEQKSADKKMHYIISWICG